MEEIFEKLRLPGVPDLRARAADVGDRQQIQRVEVSLVAHAIGERLHHVGIADVLLLRRRGHDEVVRHEPGNELGIFAGKSMRARKAQRVDRAELRMIASAALRDVVEQAGEIENLGTGEVAHQPAAQRKLVRQLGYGETTQVAHDFQYVRVYGIDVIEIVLHLPDDAAERGQVAAEHAVLVHALERPIHIRGARENAHERGTVLGFAPKLFVDEAPAAPQGAQGGSADALQLVVLLEQDERFEQRRRIALVQVLGYGFQKLAAYAEARADRVVLPVVLRRDERSQVLEQDHVQLRNRLGSPVIALHQLLAREAVRLIAHAELGCERRLMIEEQTILAPARDVVEPYAQHAEEALVALDVARFLGGDEAPLRQIRPALADPRSPRDPEYRLQVAQAAGAFLDIGLEVRFLIARVTLPLLELLRLQELTGVEHAGGCFYETTEERSASGKKARFEQASFGP